MISAILPNGKKIYSGQGFEGIISREGINTPVVGSIYISTKDRLFLCHNNKDAIGSESENKLGYKYSWVFSVGTDGLTDGVILHKLYDLLEFNIEPSFFLFLDILDLNSIKYYLINPLSKYKKFNYIKSSDKKGFVTISNKERSIDIKIGRFIKSILDDSEKIKGLFLPINNNSNIENITNKYISFQNSHFINIKILKGNDILLGYTTDNYYAKSSGSLSGSCMNNKFNFLKFYTENSNISLAVLYLDDKIVGRCLIWNIENQLYYDKMYINFDWCRDSMISYFIDNNISPIDNSKELIINLDKTNYEFYPYVDTFYFIDLQNKLLSNKIRYKNYIRSTSGFISIT